MKVHNQLLQYKYQLLCTAVALILGVIAGMLIGQGSLDQVRIELEQQEAAQRSALLLQAEAIDRTSVTPEVAAAIQDCAVSERQRFDSLLSQLNAGLSRTELVEVERLFDRCGYYYAAGRAVSAVLLQREIEAYARTLEALSTLTGDDVSIQKKLSDWRSLGAAETEKSTLFSELVRLQGEIIAALRQGNDPASGAVLTPANAASDTQQRIAEIGQKIDQTRELLNAL